MKIAFLMDDLRSIEPSNETTSHIMYECNQRGHTVYFLEPHDVYIRKNEVVARMHDITVPDGQSLEAYWQSLIQCLHNEALIFETVADLDVLFLRKNPPLSYQTMEYLSSVDDRIFIINSTHGQMIGNSKLYPLNFPDIIPETHVSRDPKRLKRIIDEFGGAMVVKPLRRFGGEGVIKVSTRDRDNLSSLIDYYTHAGKPYKEREPIMVQEYLASVKTEGDVRILLLNGEILGSMRRIPAEGEFRANVHAGGRAAKHDITDAQVGICRRIGRRLVRDGLYFVGIDVIEDKLVEINCVSPGGIPRINRLNDVRLEAKVVDFLEQKAARPNDWG
jgi:glutathione synthase